ncbi:L-fucose:H+ symporter permease [Maribacter sp. 4U21]|uniref:L-fucose:H+ symporter permease n=1 Tax=Maribacter sp. 4U21 TaxID=1889779 RepID=UPI000C1568D9|nr:L-fucose:H+ symporter permease [Maribacter sp. 4U21]PIB30422.1 L-fucose:H+ symporter permease [Maribacter sp. 4U21]
MKNNQKIPVVPKSLIVPFVLITSLFALWGFANDITNPMVSAFKKVLELSNTQASWVQAAFYGGYFTMALPAAYVSKKYSYKAGILAGLALYAVGALLFYPAAAMENYLFFLAALYILTFGLAFLETTSNPFILDMGPEETATQRLNLAQAFNPVGALTGLFVAQTFILSALQSDDVDASGNGIYETLKGTAKAAIKTSDLQVIRNPYVILGIFVIIMLVVIAFVKMPDTKQKGVSLDMWKSIQAIFKKERFVAGVFAQMFYVGAQIMCWTYIYQYAENIGISNIVAVNYAYTALIIFLIGRFICTYLLKFIDSGKLLMILSVIAILGCMGTIFLENIMGLYSLVFISFCMSLMFPTIYGIALTGLGDNAKTASAFLVMAIVGGAFMPVLQGMVLDIGGSGYSDVKIMGVPEVNFSFALPLLCFVLVALYGYRALKVYKIK